MMENKKANPWFALNSRRYIGSLCNNKHNKRMTKLLEAASTIIPPLPPLPPVVPRFSSQRSSIPKNHSGENVTRNPSTSLSRKVESETVVCVLLIILDEIESAPRLQLSRKLSITSRNR